MGGMLVRTFLVTLGGGVLMVVGVAVGLLWSPLIGCVMGAVGLLAAVGSFAYLGWKV